MKIWAECTASGVMRCRKETIDSFIPQMAPSVGYYAEITGLDPMPQPGWVHDKAGDTWSQPVAPEPEPSPEPEPEYWIYTAVSSDKDELVKDGATSAQIDIQLYLDADLTVKPTLPEAMQRIITVRSDMGLGTANPIVDKFAVTFDTTGAASVDYIVPDAAQPGMFYVDENDLRPARMPDGNEYRFKLISESGQDRIQIEVYRVP